MASYMIRGLPAGAVAEFKSRCRLALLNPDEVLRALIVNTQPEYLIEQNETRIAHRLCFHHAPPPSEVAITTVVEESKA